MRIWDFNIDYDSIAISFYCDTILFSDYVRGFGEGQRVRYVDFIEDFPVIRFNIKGKEYIVKVVDCVIKKEAENKYHYWCKVFYNAELFNKQKGE